MTLLHKYIIRSLFSSTLLVLLVLVGFLAFMDFAVELDDLGKGQYQLLDILQYTLLSIPKRVYQILPIAALIGSVIGLGNLASQSELVAMRAAGISVVQISKAVMLFALILMLVAVFVGEVVRPPAEKAARQMRSLALTGTVSEQSKFGFWTRDGQHFNHIARIDPDGRFSDVTIYEFDKQRHLRSLTHARQARYEGKDWLLHDVTQSQIDNQGIIVRTLRLARWHSRLNPGMVNIVIVPPEYLSVWDLLAYIDYLKTNDQDVSPYQLAFWSKLLMPVSSVIMVFLAIPFVFGPLRSASLGGRIFLGVLVGIGFHITNQTFQHMGLVFGIPPWIAAALPSLFFAALGAMMMKRIF